MISHAWLPASGSILRPLLAVDGLPVRPGVALGVLAFVFLFVLFGLRGEREGEGEGGCGGHGCSSDGCSGCDLEGDAGEGHGSTWNFATDGGGRRSPASPRTTDSTRRTDR